MADSVSTRTSTIQWLAALPRSERRDALEPLVVAEFKTTLLMAAEDELPREQSFFDLGLTSLRLTEVKQRLDALLGRSISANSLFNRPTMAALIEHMCDEVLPELFTEPAPDLNQVLADDPVAAANTADPALVDSLLQDLYRARS